MMKRRRADWAVDWGEHDRPRLTRSLMRRVFGYFRPYRARGALVLVCIVGDALLGLAPALVFKALIDYLAHPAGHHFTHVTARSLVRADQHR